MNEPNETQCSERLRAVLIMAKAIVVTDVSNLITEGYASIDKIMIRDHTSSRYVCAHVRGALEVRAERKTLEGDAVTPRILLAMAEILSEK